MTTPTTPNEQETADDRAITARWIELASQMPYPDESLDDYVLTPEGWEMVMRNTFAPDTEIDKLFEGFNWDAGLA